MQRLTVRNNRNHNAKEYNMMKGDPFLKELNRTKEIFCKGLQLTILTR